MEQLLIRENVLLAPFSTYKIGGKAERFCEPATEMELKEVIQWAKENDQPITVLGGGSNILISDQGIRGLVIKPSNNKVEIEDNRMTIGAAALVKTISEQAFEAGLSGLEWAIGIPGFVGGAIRGNAGAHGGSFDQIVKEVIVFDTESLTLTTYTPDMCNFTYRHSFFKDNPRYIIWEVKVELLKGDIGVMEKQMEEYREYRRTSQPAEPSAGCIFKNLLVSDVEKVNPAVVRMAEEDNKVRGGKIGAGYLIEKLNLPGYQIGGAEISLKHANFVVNTGKATAADVLGVMEYIKNKVKGAYQTEFEAEVQIL